MIYGSLIGSDTVKTSSKYSRLQNLRLMSTATRIVKNSGYLYAKMGITLFITLYTTRLILNALGEEDFGIFNIVGGAIAMLGFFNAALSGSTQRFISYTEGSGDKERLVTIFNISVVLHTILSILVIVVLGILGLFLFDDILNIPDSRIPAARMVYGSLIVSTAFTIMTAPYDAVLNAHENMRYYAIIGLVESALKLGVALVVVHTSGDKLIIYGILMAVIPLISLSAMRIYCHCKYQECKLSIFKYFNKGLMREMTVFAGWNFFQTAAAMITNYGMGIVMNIFFGAKINAAQGLANQINGQLSAVDNVLMKAVRPVITKDEGGGEKVRSLRMAQSVCKASFFATLLFALPAILTMPRLLKLWLQNIPEYTTFFASSLLIITLLEQSVSGFNVVIMARGKIRGYSTLKSCIKISYLPLIYLLYRAGYSPIIGYTLLIVIQGCINGVTVTLYYMNKQLKYSVSQIAQELFLPMILTGIPIGIVGVLLACIEGVIGLCMVWAICVPLTIILSYFTLTDKTERIVLKSMISRLIPTRKR